MAALWSRTCWSRRVLATSLLAKHTLRPLSIGATLCAKSQSKPAASIDPVQQLFLEKLKEYQKKSSGDKLPDMTADSEKQYQDELNRVYRVFGGGDMTKFPEFSFVDKPPPEE